MTKSLDGIARFLRRLFCKHKSTISFPAHKSNFMWIEMVYCKDCCKLIDIQEHRLFD